MIALAYIFYFIAATVAPLQRRWLATNKNPANDGQIIFAFQVTLVIGILGLLLPLFQPMQFEGSWISITGLTIITGIFGAAFYVTWYVSQKYVEAGISFLVRNINVPIAIVLATIFLNERLTLIQVLGTTLLLAGVFVVSKKHQLGKFKFDKYFLMMVLSGVCLGILLTAERALQKTTGFTTGTLLSWWSQCISLGVIAMVMREKSIYSLKDICITGGLKFIHSLSWVVLIFVVGNLSLVASITTFNVVIMFAAAALFLGERENLGRKILGSIIALIGLLLIK